ncbi:MAG: serpin family protein [Synechococcales cyanobacterium C42_A2020_086]|jgi:serpin B|nr:serpin family protein [Synechococcales cyanobacterium C42_A2020_086]
MSYVHLTPIKQLWRWLAVLAAGGLTLTLLGYGIMRPAGQARLPEPLHPETTILGQVETPDPEPASSELMDVDPRLIEANTRFGFKLFSQVWQPSNATNLLISPSSIAMALTMTYNGASGSTQQAIATALEIQNLTLEELNAANAALRTSLETADPQVKLAIANSLWGRQDFAFNPDFLQRNQQFYDAEIASLDFASPEATDRINTWVNQNTEGKIPTIIDRIDPQHVLFLINAVYFNGTWTTQFNPAATQDRPFTRLDGSQKNHPLMSQSGSYLYRETEQFQAISLPYGEGRFSLYVFLPSPDSNLNEFLQTLTPENWNRWMSEFARRPGAIRLPKFTFEYNTSLNEVLQALGMAVAFDPNQADFSNLSDTPTFISDVKHKTFIEVNEEGTEAAATTSVGIAVTSAPVDPPFEMVVDRPFFCAIRDNQTGSLLFMGAVVDPE